jgi:hypothetical protein
VKERKDRVDDALRGPVPLSLMAIQACSDAVSRSTQKDNYQRHPTSIRLEPAFWGWLREIAATVPLPTPHSAAILSMPFPARN